MEHKYFWVFNCFFLHILICAPDMCTIMTSQDSRRDLLWLLRKLYLYCLHGFMFVSKSLDKNAAVVTLPGVEKLIPEELTSQVLGSGNIVLLLTKSYTNKYVASKLWVDFCFSLNETLISIYKINLMDFELFTPKCNIIWAEIFVGCFPEPFINPAIRWILTSL